MRWLKFRFDPGSLGSRGSFPWQAWPEKTGRRVTVYDAHGEIVLIIDEASRERAVLIGRLLEEMSWAMRESEAAAAQCNSIARTMSDRGLWAATDEHGGGRWWRRIFRRG